MIFLTPFFAWLLVEARVCVAKGSKWIAMYMISPFISGTCRGDEVFISC